MDYRSHQNVKLLQTSFYYSMPLHSWAFRSLTPPPPQFQSLLRKQYAIKGFITIAPHKHPQTLNPKPYHICLETRLNHSHMQTTHTFTQSTSHLHSWGDPTTAAPTAVAAAPASADGGPRGRLGSGGNCTACVVGPGMRNGESQQFVRSRGFQREQSVIRAITITG